ncbi:group II intron reverse transcriptase/maturase [Cuniculiplasma sp. SKW3]|uniref:group II intron reverse transcriptase/maturase n=1 Tax=Cuniculiplasma sp. SKW3 TaxID=3400170 RepID=UPI003FD33A32
MKTLELLQDGLYHAAKDGKDRKFYSLHDKICRTDILQDAWKHVSANNGSPGIDWKSIEDIESYGVPRFLEEIQNELMNMTYRIPNVKRVYIPKQDGKKRPLGIPTVKDRVVQQAVKSVIEPIFEADFKDFSYAYRRGKSAKQASHEIFKYLNYGYTGIVEIDITGFFDHIDHEKMIHFLMKRIADPYVIKLIREWLRAGIVYNGETTYPSEGTPQGGVISPLLANIYLNEMDTLWSKKVDANEAVMIRYADDVLVLSKNNPEKHMDLVRRILDLLGLELNVDKSKITDIAQGIDFLGIHYQRRYSNMKKRGVVRMYPSRKSMEKFRGKVKELTKLTKTHVKSMDVLITELNALIRGYTNYFNHTNATKQYKSLYRFIEWKVSKFYCHLHKISRASYKTMYIGIGRILGLMPMTGRISYI